MIVVLLSKGLIIVIHLNDSKIRKLMENVWIILCIGVEKVSLITQFHLHILGKLSGWEFVIWQTFLMQIQLPFLYC